MWTGPVGIEPYSYVKTFVCFSYICIDTGPEVRTFYSFPWCSWIKWVRESKFCIGNEDEVKKAIFSIYWNFIFTFLLASIIAVGTSLSNIDCVSTYIVFARSRPARDLAVLALSGWFGCSKMRTDKNTIELRRDTKLVLLVKSLWIIHTC